MNGAPQTLSEYVSTLLAELEKETSNRREDHQTMKHSLSV